MDALVTAKDVERYPAMIPQWVTDAERRALVYEGYITVAGRDWQLRVAVPEGASMSQAR